MKIGIDASRYSSEEATGVEWYSWHIINHLVKLIEEDELVLYLREKNKDLKKGKVLEAKKLWTMKALTLEMKENPPDVLFVPSHVLPRVLPVRSVIMIHDVAFKRVRQAYSWKQKAYLDWSTKFAVKNATKILTPSEATAEDLRQFYSCPEEKLVVIPHGFEVGKKTKKRFQHPLLSDQDKYLFFVGRLEEKKNLGRLAEAFALLEDKSLKMVWAGSRGHNFDKIWKRVVALGLEERIVMPGYVTEEEKSSLFKGASGFVFPSLYEGFGLPILESFHHGVPVMCSDSSSLPEVGGKAVVYCQPYDIDSMKSAMEELLEDEGELVTLGKERLKNFSWEKAAKKTLEVILG